MNAIQNQSSHRWNSRQPPSNHFVFFVGAMPHQLTAKTNFSFPLKRTNKKQNDGAHCTTKKHY